MAWFEEDRSSGESFLHVNDRLSSESGKALARRAVDAIQASLPTNLTLRDIADRVGTAYDELRVRQGYASGKWQRNNVTGTAFEATLQVIIGRLFGILPSRTPQLQTLAGFELAPPGYHSRPDLVMFSSRDFRLLISTKWTLRKERLGTYLHEAYFYKQRRPDLQVAFVVAEFNLSILRWLCDDPLVDRVYHVSRNELLRAHQPFDLGQKTVDVDLLLKVEDKQIRDYRRWLSLEQKLFSLEQLFEDIDKLRSSAEDDPLEDDSSGYGYNEDNFE